MPVLPIPIDINMPETSSNAGNAFWNSVALTAYDAGLHLYLPDVDGDFSGRCLIDLQGLTFSSAQLRLVCSWNATTGVSRMSASYDSPAETASMNPGSFTALTAQDITVPATARLRKDIIFTGVTGIVDKDIFNLKITHEGAHTNDTVAVDTELWWAQLEITAT